MEDSPVSYTHLDVYKRQDLQDIDFKNNGIKIRRKGGYEAVIYFGEEVETAVSYTHLDVYKRQCLKLLQKMK